MSDAYHNGAAIDRAILIQSVRIAHLARNWTQPPKLAFSLLI